MMTINRCLYCYEPLEEGQTDYHKKCSLAFFGTPVPPVLDYSGKQMEELAKQIVLRSVALTGVQPKLSLTIEKKAGDPKHLRLNIVGLWGDYILKPPTPEFPHLPENEGLTMRLAGIFSIPAAKHSLIRLSSGELAYITKRFDREKKEKLALEDMCQLTETLTNDKYGGSMEKIGRYIKKYSTRPGLDRLIFFETVLFSFMTGDADMHLKNFALLTTARGEIILSPAYDLVSTKIAIPEDKDEMALTINAKRRKLTRSDFDGLAVYLEIPEKAMTNSYEKFSSRIKEANRCIGISFLPDKVKEEYTTIIREALDRIGLI